MKKNKKEKKFVKSILPWTLLGFVVGFFIPLLDDVKIKISFDISIIGYISTIISLLLFIISIIYILQVRNKINKLTDDMLDILDKKIDLSVIFSNISLMFAFLYFGILFYSNKLFDTNIIVGYILLIIFIIICFATSYIQFIAIKYLKVINPEKKGNPFDVNFNKEFYNSCDEIQKQMLGEVCYKSYMIITTILIYTFLLLIFIGMFINIGILSIIIVGILNIVNMMIYGTIAYRMEHKK